METTVFRKIVPRPKHLRRRRRGERHVNQAAVPVRILQPNLRFVQVDKDATAEREHQASMVRCERRHRRSRKPRHASGGGLRLSFLNVG